MSKSASKRGRPLVVNRNDFLQALTVRVVRIGNLINTSHADDLNSAGMRLLQRCYAAAKDDLQKASKEG